MLYKYQEKFNLDYLAKVHENTLYLILNMDIIWIVLFAFNI